MHLAASDFQFENESLPDSQVFELGPVESIPIWNRLPEIIADAKAQKAGKSAPLTPVVVDFGPYNFFENDRVQVKSSNTSKVSVKGQSAVRFALGFKPETEVWSMCPNFLFFCFLN